MTVRHGVILLPCFNAATMLDACNVSRTQWYLTDYINLHLNYIFLNKIFGLFMKNYLNCHKISKWKFPYQTTFCDLWWLVEWISHPVLVRDGSIGKYFIEFKQYIPDTNSGLEFVHALGNLQLLWFVYQLNNIAFKNSLISLRMQRLLRFYK